MIYTWECYMLGLARGPPKDHQSQCNQQERLLYHIHLGSHTPVQMLITLRGALRDHSLNLQSSVTILLPIGLCKWQSYSCISNWFGLGGVGHGYSFSILGQIWTSPRLYPYVVITCVCGWRWGGVLVQVYGPHPVSWALVIDCPL